MTTLESSTLNNQTTNHLTMIDKALPYRFFRHASIQLNDIAPVDFFLAKELIHLFIDNNLELDDHQVEQAFHVVMKLSEFLRDGHSCLPLSQIANKTLWGNVDSQGIVTHQGFTFDNFTLLESLFADSRLSETDLKPLVFDESKLYLRRYFCFEQEVNRYIKDTLEAMVEDSLEPNQLAKITNIIDSLFPQSNDAQSPDWQKVAVANALNKNFSIIAGGPGTGKTYTVTKLLAALVMLNDQHPLNIVLTAPTGKAAQRLSESILAAKTGFKGLVSNEVLDAIPIEAKTLHRLLGVIPSSPKFKHHGDNKLALDVLLIDEVSMVDLPMMARLLDALPSNTKLILLGDAQQLPSVAAGSILADLTPFANAQYSTSNRKFLNTVTQEKLPGSKKSFADHVTYLTFSRRFSGEGGIGKLARFIIDGEANDSWQLLQRASLNNSELEYCLPGDYERVLQRASHRYKTVTEASNVKEAFERLSGYRILVAMRKGTFGVETINSIVEQHITNTSQVKTQSYYQGKPIMITTNDYQLGLYNGDIGIIWPNEQGQLYAYFEAEHGEFKAFMPSRLPSHETVYAMTIHKTQGSEFSHVELLLPQSGSNQMLTRELVYTGVTRAKKKLSIMSDKSQWFQAVESKVERFSGIKVVN